jgi:hypothetical protein
MNKICQAPYRCCPAAETEQENLIAGIVVFIDKLIALQDVFCESRPSDTTCDLVAICSAFASQKDLDRVIVFRVTYFLYPRN